MIASYTRYLLAILNWITCAYYTTFALAYGGGFRYNFRHTDATASHACSEEVIALTAVHSFGALVRRKRKALDLTQAALAQRVGCAESLIRKIEAEERRPSRQVAERLADALQIVPEAREL